MASDGRAKPRPAEVGKCAPLDENIIQMCVDSPADVHCHSIMSSSPIMCDNLPVLLMKPQPVLCDMPEHIKEKIVDLLNPVSKLKLGQCSKNFKKLVDKSSFHYEILEVSLYPNATTINVWDDENFEEIEFEQDTDAQQEEGVHDDIKQAKEIVSRILRVNQQVPVTMNTLRICYDRADFPDLQDRHSRLMNCLQETLASRKHQLCVKKLRVQFLGAQELSKILLHLKPIVLKSINLVSDHKSIWLELENDVLESEQWKGAKMLYAEDFRLNLSYANYEHFKGININVKDGLTLEQLKSLIEKSFKMPRHLRKQIFSKEQMEREEIRNYLNLFEKIDRTRRIVPIPGSLDHLIVQFDEFFNIFSIRRYPPESE